MFEWQSAGGQACGLKTPLVSQTYGALMRQVQLVFELVSERRQASMRTEGTLLKGRLQRLEQALH